MYQITDLQYSNARRLGVTIKPSSSKRKKIDVYKGDTKVGSIGGVKLDGSYYGDFSMYLRTTTNEIANARRAAYLARHASEPKKTANGSYTNSFYADRILW
jgi:hypothetical protein